MAIQSWIEMLLLQLKGSAETKSPEEIEASFALDQTVCAFRCQRPLPSAICAVFLPFAQNDFRFTACGQCGHFISRLFFWHFFIILDGDLYSYNAKNTRRTWWILLYHKDMEIGKSEIESLRIFLVC